MGSIEAETDDAAWSAALDRMIALCDEASLNASMAAAGEIQDRTRELLTELHHAPNTRTPSPRGAPPADITGLLAASISVSGDGDWAEVGPTSVASSKNGPYGRFLELGGTHEAHNPTGAMHWFEDGAWHHAAVLDKGERPFLKPATESAIDDGTVHQIYYDHWLAAIEEATA